MSRVAKKINCSELDIIELKRRQNQSEDPQMQKRASMILMCHSGYPVKQIAEELGDYPNNVIKWRDRYEKYGIDGLKNKNIVDNELKNRSMTEQMMELLRQEPPKGYDHWDAQLISEHMKLSKDHVWRLLRASGIQLERKRTWSILLHDANQKRNLNIVGFFLGDKERALVFRINNENTYANRSGLYFHTRQRKLYEQLTQATRDEGLTLIDVLKLSAEFGGRSDRFNRREVVMSEFITSLTNSENWGNSADYHMLFFSNQENTMPIELAANNNIVLHKSETFDEWKSKTSFLFELFYDGSASYSQQLMLAIDTFLHSVSDQTDPFICQALA